MGDRVLFVLHNGDEVADCIVYAHNHGWMAPKFLAELEAVMGNRLNDIRYSTARLFQIIANNSKGNLGVGTLPVDGADPNDYTTVEGHGDRGVVWFDVTTSEVFHVKAYGRGTARYGTTGEFAMGFYKEMPTVLAEALGMNAARNNL